MPKTTEQQTTSTETDGDIAARIQAEKKRIRAEWDRNEERGKDARADVLAQRRVFYQLEQERVGDIRDWEQRLAREGCRPVLSAWPTIPVPRSTSAPYAPTDRMTAIKTPRPVVYNASVYRLDEKGIWLRRAGYWISSPTFQIASGTDDANPDVYAVAVNGEWRTVPVDPRQTTQRSGVVLTALTDAGLRLNPEPVHHDANLNAVPATRFRNHFIVAAEKKLDAFLADHAREIRP